MSKFHITLHIELEADNIFTAQRKGENITNNIPEEYNCYVQSVIEEKEKEKPPYEDTARYDYDHKDCENYWEMFYYYWETEDGEERFEKGCYADNDPDTPYVCRDFKKPSCWEDFE